MLWGMWSARWLTASLSTFHTETLNWQGCCKTRWEEILRQSCWRTVRLQTTITTKPWVLCVTHPGPSSSRTSPSSTRIQKMLYSSSTQSRSKDWRLCCLREMGFKGLWYARIRSLGRSKGLSRNRGWGRSSLGRSRYSWLRRRRRRQDCSRG